MFNMPLAVAPHVTPPTPAAPPKQSTASVTTTAMLVNAASYDAASTLAWSKAVQGGVPDVPREGQVELMARGVSNLHIDRVDSRRRRGVPIVYVPRISAAARADPRYHARHAMPSSDIVIAENGCSEHEGGGRVFRVVTCTDGWMCIVCAHFDTCLHGGVYPVGPEGGIVDPASGRPYLEQKLVPGVELLRCVLYQMARVDDFCFAVQAEYDVRADGSGQECERQRQMLGEVYHALRAPLDERLRMLHPWLPPKDDDDESRPFGDRGRWEMGGAS